MGFIQQLLQNNPQLQQLLQGQAGQSAPQAGQQSRFGQQGLMESMRQMKPPTPNLPQQGGSGFGSQIQEMIAAMRDRLGQQGIGGQFQGGLGSGLNTPQINPKMPQQPMNFPQQPRPQLPRNYGVPMPTGGGGPIGAPAPPTGIPFNGGITERFGPGGLLPNPSPPTGQAAPAGSTITERFGKGGLVPGSSPTTSTFQRPTKPAPVLQSKYGNLAR